MRGLILAGGLGTRLRPFTFTIPKPLLPIGEKPILEFILKGLGSAGIKDVALAVGFQAELIRAYCQDGSQFGLNISYLTEDKPLGTAGPISFFRDLVTRGEELFVMNGDIVTRLDFRELVVFHREHGFDMTVAYKELEDTSPYGILEIQNNQIRNIIEKPKRTYRVSTGIYVLSDVAIQLVPHNTFFTVPELVMKMIEKDHRVGAFAVNDFWMGIETLTNLNDAMEALKVAEKEMIVSHARGEAEVPRVASAPQPQVST